MSSHLSSLARFALLLSLFMYTGCREAIPEEAPPAGYRVPAAESAPAGSPVTLVMGIDGSGSGRPLRDWCFGGARAALAAARAGDQVEVRMIGSSAFSVDLQVTRLDLPRPRAASAFDLKARAAASNDRSIDSLRAASLAALDSARARAPTGKTDLGGFLGATAAVLASVPAGSRRVLVLCSDFDDTEGTPVSLDLSGTTAVLMVGAGTGDTSAEVMERQARWTQELAGRGAQVRVMAPGSALRPDEYLGEKEAAP